jgi:hypothetical protein
MALSRMRRLVGDWRVNFRESTEVPGVFYNVHFPELFIHHASTDSFLVTYQGEVVREAQSLFAAFEQARQYISEGGAQG